MDKLIMDKLNSEKGQRSSPTVYADNSSVTFARIITNANEITNDIVTGGDPGRSQTGNAAGQVPQADCTALRGSVIIVDNMYNVGNINTSVNTSRVGAGTAAEMVSSSQDSAVEYMEH